MALLEKVADRLVHNQAIRFLISLTFGTFTTLWLIGFLFDWSQSPLHLVLRIADYLGIGDAPKAINPVIKWFDAPRRDGLFAVGAVAAAIMFSLSGSLQVAIHADAALIGWLLFLAAVQGVGVWPALAVTVGTSAVLFIGALFVEWRSLERARFGELTCVAQLHLNILAGLDQGLFPVAVTMSWVHAIYDREALTRHVKESIK